LVIVITILGEVTNLFLNNQFGKVLLIINEIKNEYCFAVVEVALVVDFRVLLGKWLVGVHCLRSPLVSLAVCVSTVCSEPFDNSLNSFLLEFIAVVCIFKGESFFLMQQGPAGHDFLAFTTISLVVWPGLTSFFFRSAERTHSGVKHSRTTWVSLFSSHML